MARRRRHAAPAAPTAPAPPSGCSAFAPKTSRSTCGGEPASAGGRAYRRVHRSDDDAAGRLGRSRMCTSWFRAERPCGPGDRVHPRIDAGARRACSIPAPDPACKPPPDEGDAMTARPFEPKFMKMSVLTAALQELTPREIRDEDPDRAIEEWLRVRARARLPEHPALGRAAPDRDRRAARGDARPGRQHARPAQAVRQDARQARARGDEGDGRRHHRPRVLRQPAPRRQRPCARRSIDFMLRVFDAAALLGHRGRVRLRRPQPEAADGPEPRRSSRKSSSRCSRRRRRAASSTASSSARCPAGPSATTSTTTSPTRPGTWIALHRICEKHGVGDQFRIHYDPSHAILMGQDTRSIFQYLKDEGYDFIDRRLSRQGPGRSTRRASRPGATAARPWSAATG